MDQFSSMFASQSFWRSLDTTVPPETAVDPFTPPWESNNFLARMGEAPIHSTPRLQPLDTTKAQVEAVIAKQRQPHCIKSGVVATAPSSNGEFTILVTEKAYKRPPVKWVPRKKVIPFPKKEVSLESSDKEEWTGAVAKWQALAEEAGRENSNLAKLLVDLQGSSSAEGILEAKCAEHIKADINEVMSDPCGITASSTLRQRVGRVAMYIRWCRSMGYAPFPLTPDQVYLYVKACRTEKAPATRAVEVIKGLRLATHIL